MLQLRGQHKTHQELIQAWVNLLPPPEVPFVDLPELHKTAANVPAYMLSKALLNRATVLAQQQFPAACITAVDPG